MTKLCPGSGSPVRRTLVMPSPRSTLGDDAKSINSVMDTSRSAC